LAKKKFCSKWCVGIVLCDFLLEVWKFLKITYQCFSLFPLPHSIFAKEKMKPWSQLAHISCWSLSQFQYLQCSMEWLGVFLLPLGGMVVHCRSLLRNLLGFPITSPVPIYSPGRRKALCEFIVLPKNTTQCPLARA